MIAVESSDLRAVDYDWSGTLTIAFHNGRIYDHPGVPDSDYMEFMHAPSLGVNTTTTMFAVATAEKL
jgi:hypothetical protein